MGQSRGGQIDKIQRPVFTLYVVSICLLLGMPLGAMAQDTAASKISSKYKDALVMLRNPYCGEELKFDLDANLVSNPARTDWKTCQTLRIRDLQVHDGKTTIAAQRVRTFYNCSTQQVQDVPDRDVSIEVQLQPNSDEKSVLELMDKIFSPLDQAPGIFHVGNGITAPIPIYSPDPDYSDQAHRANYEGMVVLTVVVGADGRVHDPKVVRSLGMGLDEKAIEKIKVWRFKPATRCGSPVPVEVNIEITFKVDKR